MRRILSAHALVPPGLRGQEFPHLNCRMPACVCSTGCCQEWASTTIPQHPQNTDTATDMGSKSPVGGGGQMARHATSTRQSNAEGTPGYSQAHICIGGRETRCHWLLETIRAGRKTMNARCMRCLPSAATSACREHLCLPSAATFCG